MLTLLSTVPAGALLCDSTSKSVPFVHVGPAGYDDGHGGIASSGAAEAAVHN